MNKQRNDDLTPQQSHFVRSIMDGKREIREEEALIRKEKLSLHHLLVPCAVICVSPYYTKIRAEEKDDGIYNGLEYVRKFLCKEGYLSLCLTNSYDNIQIILPTIANKLTEHHLDALFIRLHNKFNHHFGLELFIGIGSEAVKYADISRSSIEATEMLAYKYQYADRGVISILNTARFKHYSVYGENIMFARVIGRFQDGDLPMMSVRLAELIEFIRQRPTVSKTAIKRTFVELAVNILHIAANADIDVDAVIGDADIYSWVMRQNHTEVLTEWLLNISGKLLDQMDKRQDTEEKEIIKQSCEFILQHLGDPNLSLQMVSGAVGLSSAYFSQLFKTEKGIGLNSYITECRILQAQKMLQDGEKKIIDIALQLGFTTATYFGRVFKRSTGMTPKEYRMHYQTDRSKK